MSAKGQKLVDSQRQDASDAIMQMKRTIRVHARTFHPGGGVTIHHTATFPGELLGPIMFTVAF